MTDPTPGFPRDAAILLRYRWFIIAVFVIAVAGAVAVALRGSSESTAGVSVEVWQTERQPVYGPRPVFLYSEYRRLTTSTAVAERAAGLLAAAGFDVDPAAFQASTSVSDTTSPDLQAIGARQFGFTATASDEATARAYADAWAEAYVEEASIYQDAQGASQIESLERQLDTAGTDVVERQRELDAFLREHPEASLVPPADLERQQGRVTLALARLEDIQANGGATPAEAQIAIGDLFPDENLPAVDVATLVQGLSLRLAALNDALAEFEAPGSLASEARALSLARDGAEETYRAAQVQLTAAIAAGPVPPLEFRVPGDSTVSTSRELGLVGLAGAAGAFGLVVGVVGAFALEYLDRNRLLPWSHRSESA